MGEVDLHARAARAFMCGAEDNYPVLCLLLSLSELLSLELCVGVGSR